MARKRACCTAYNIDILFTVYRQIIDAGSARESELTGPNFCSRGIALPIITGIALLVFFWGLIKFIASAGDTEKRKDGKQFMVWGVVALFVMFAIWGIIAFINTSLGLPRYGGGSIFPPCIELPGADERCPSADSGGG